ncbi:hypothetical protein [Achromobacter xylosoxidans]|uniref:hypothetical protein n=1 Tax=Alcaligenes xylosoxydans xylosoxydans TaxID=85698 RepID=UPI0011D19F3D|nr:hypothetical protein [Achromobacter xylosoxidans]
MDKKENVPSKQQSAKNYEKAQMHNAVPYGSNRLFLFWMPAKLRPCSHKIKPRCGKKNVDNYVDKIAPSSDKFSKKTNDDHRSQTDAELCQLASVKMPLEKSRDRIIHTFIHAHPSCGPPLRESRERPGTDSLTRQVSCTSIDGFTIILLGEGLPFM